jgi:hypothetical protein
MAVFVLNTGCGSKNRQTGIFPTTPKPIKIINLINLNKTRRMRFAEGTTEKDKGGLKDRPCRHIHIFRH